MIHSASARRIPYKYPLKRSPQAQIIAIELKKQRFSWQILPVDYLPLQRLQALSNYRANALPYDAQKSTKTAITDDKYMPLSVHYHFSTDDTQNKWTIPPKMLQTVSLKSRLHNIEGLYDFDDLAETLCHFALIRRIAVTCYRMMICMNILGRNTPRPIQVRR